jgi:hypothetical protein
MYAHKETLQDVIGKTIRSIVFRSGRHVHPETQLFLVFEDDTYLEFYGQQIDFGRSLSVGDAARALNYALKFGSDVLVVNRQEA